MRTALVVALVSLLAACSTDESNANNGGQADAARDSSLTDVRPDARMDSSSDARMEADSGADMPADGSAPDLAARDTAAPDMDAADASPDSADGAADMGDPYAGRPTGQCVSTSDCPDNPNGKSCSRSAPGGVCLACGNDTHCPGVGTCTMFGACAFDCSTDAECAPGTECDSFGRCRITRCDNGVCPVPLFGCSGSGLCERVDCSSDPAACPADTTCTNGLCVEDRAL